MYELMESQSTIHLNVPSRRVLFFVYLLPVLTNIKHPTDLVSVLD